MEDSVVVKPPRVKECKVQMECKVLEIKPLGNEGGAGNLVICEVLIMHVNEAMFLAELEDPDTGKPVTEPGVPGKLVITALDRIGQPCVRFGGRARHRHLEERAERHCVRPARVPRREALRRGWRHHR